MSLPGLRRPAITAGRSLPPLGGGTSPVDRWIGLIPLTLASLACVFFALLPPGGAERREVALLASLLLAAALVTGKLTLKTLRHKRPVRAHVFRRGSFWRSLAVGVVLCYAAVLAKGNSPSSPFWLAALVTLWWGGFVIGLAVDPRVLQAWHWLSQRKSIKRAGAAMQATVLLTVCLEIALQVHQRWFVVGWPATASVQGAALVGLMPEATTFSNAHTARLHVALLGDELIGAAERDHQLAAVVNRALPTVSVSGLAQPAAGPREFARLGNQLRHVARPDLLLVFVSAAEDVAATPVESDWFDWRSVQLVHQAERMLTLRSSTWCLETNSVANDHESTVNELAVCRVPSDSFTEIRWQKLTRDLERLHRQCQRGNVEMVLVVVPADFQLNRALYERLCRRAGWDPAALDRELPQRRLAAFAASCGLASIDLLPHLQHCPQQVFERGRRTLTGPGCQAVAQAVGSWLEAGLGQVAFNQRSQGMLR